MAVYGKELVSIRRKYIENGLIKIDAPIFGTIK